MASEAPTERQTCVRTCEASVLGEQLLRAGPQQNPAVDDAAFGRPAHVGPRLRAPPLHRRCVVVLRGGGGLTADLSFFTLLFLAFYYLTLRRAVTNTHEGLGRVEPEDAHRAVGPVGQQQRHRAVQAAAAVHLVGEGVQVVETIGLPVSVKSHHQHPTEAKRG